MIELLEGGVLGYRSVREGRGVEERGVSGDGSVRVGRNVSGDGSVREGGGCIR